MEANKSTLADLRAKVLEYFSAWSNKNSVVSYTTGAGLREQLTTRDFPPKVEIVLFRTAFAAWVKEHEHLKNFKLKMTEEIGQAECFLPGIPLRVTVKRFDKLIEDCFCRDFTVNALYFSLKGNRTTDLCSGLQDLRAKVVRPVVTFETTFFDAPERFFSLAELILKGYSMDSELSMEIEKFPSSKDFAEATRPNKCFVKTMTKLFDQEAYGKTLRCFSKLKLVRLFFDAGSASEELKPTFDASLKFVEKIDRDYRERLGSSPLFGLLLTVLFGRKFEDLLSGSKFRLSDFITSVSELRRLFAAAEPDDSSKFMSHHAALRLLGDK